LDYQPSVSQIEYRMLGATEHLPDGCAGELPDETPPAHSAQDVGVAERDLAELSADQGGADVADDGFDFGQLGHRTLSLMRFDYLMIQLRGGEFTTEARNTWKSTETNS